jgi:hypothetical protein
LLGRRIGGFTGGVALTALLVMDTRIVPSIVDLLLAPVYLVAAVLVLGTAVSLGDVPVRRLAPVTLVAVVLAGGFAVADVLVPHQNDAPGAAGVPVVTVVPASGGHLPVLVAPGRPGPNLVYLDGNQAVRVGTDPRDPRPVTQRPGAGGRWALVELPAGASKLWVSGVPIDVDAGHGSPLPGIAGPDGPECASAALGAALAGSRRTLPGCPADSLTPGDAESLRGLVRLLAARGVRTLTIAADGSPRSSSAATVLHDSARASGLTIAAAPAADSALVVVSGWAAATATLSDLATRQRAEVIHSAGTYLAPWLLAAPVLRAGNGAVLPLRFDPRDDAPVHYQLALESAFHTFGPTASGYYEWRAAQGLPEPSGTRLYAASVVSLMPQEFAHHTPEGGWLPGGTVVPVTGPLT